MINTSILDKEETSANLSIPNQLKVSTSDKYSTALFNINDSNKETCYLSENNPPTYSLDSIKTLTDTPVP